MAANIGTYINKENLPGDLLGNLEAITINAGSKFLSGEVSNVFGGSVRNIVDNSMTIYNTVTDPNLYKKLSTQLIEHCVTVTTNELLAYVSDKTTDLLSLDKIKNVLLDSVTYWTKERILGPGEILSKIQTKNISKESEKEQKRIQESQLSNIKTTITEGVGKVKEYTTNTISALDSGLSTITAYITQGPDWVVTQANTYVSLAIDRVESFISTQTDFLERSRDAAIDSLGNAIGSMAANIVNTIAVNTAKKAKSEAEKLISVAQTKVLNVITKAIMIIRQLTGIAIPPVYPKLPNLTSLF